MLLVAFVSSPADQAAETTLRRALEIEADQMDGMYFVDAVLKTTTTDGFALLDRLSDLPYANSTTRLRPTGGGCTIEPTLGGAL